QMIQVREQPVSFFACHWPVRGASKTSFIQWFVVVPRLFEKKELTVLNLRQAVPTPRHDSEISKQPAAEPDKDLNAESPSTISSRTIIANRSQTRTRRKTTSRFAAFDRRGRTPLERVIDNL